MHEREMGFEHDFAPEDEHQSWTGRCPYCVCSFVVSSQRAGETIRCEQCHEIFWIPAYSPSEEADDLARFLVPCGSCGEAMLQFATFCSRCGAPRARGLHWTVPGIAPRGTPRYGIARRLGQRSSRPPEQRHPPVPEGERRRDTARGGPVRNFFRRLRRLVAVRRLVAAILQSICRRWGGSESV